MFDEVKIKFNLPVRYDHPYERWGRTYPREFFDRKDALQVIESRLQDLSSRQPIAIIGERRSGKTSMLWYLAEKHREDFTVLHGPEYGVQTAIAFLQALWMDVAPAEPPPPNHAIYIEWQEQLIHRMEAQVKNGNKPILLWIDRLDAIFGNQQMAYEEKDKILGFLSTLIEGTDISVKLVFSTTHEFLDIPHLRSSPLGDKAFCVPLKPFPRQAAAEMVQAMLEDGHSWGEVASFWDWPRFCAEIGCQPYYMKALLVHLGRVWRKHDGAIEKEDWWDEAIQATLQGEVFSKTLEHIYHCHFSEDEKAVVLWMVRSGGRVRVSALEEASLLEAAKTLEKRFYLQRSRNERGEDAFTFHIGLVGRWLAQEPKFTHEWRTHRRRTLSL